MLQAWTRMLVAMRSDQRGQSTVEYFLVILAAVALAIIVIHFVQNNGSGGVGNFFKNLLDNAIGWIAKVFTAG